MTTASIAGTPPPIADSFKLGSEEITKTILLSAATLAVGLKFALVLGLAAPWAAATLSVLGPALLLFAGAGFVRGFMNGALRKDGIGTSIAAAGFLGAASAMFIPGAAVIAPFLAIGFGVLAATRLLDPANRNVFGVWSAIIGAASACLGFATLPHATAPQGYAAAGLMIGLPHLSGAEAQHPLDVSGTESRPDPLVNGYTTAVVDTGDYGITAVFDSDGSVNLTTSGNPGMDVTVDANGNIIDGDAGSYDITRTPDGGVRIESIYSDDVLIIHPNGSYEPSGAGPEGGKDGEPDEGYLGSFVERNESRTATTGMLARLLAALSPR
ncbi:MAG: hypothetical protein GC131_08820 [Alphaproteobacteria bacterium]|nr:hypothetical protein [Alphaproteobacteria bacterium]